MEPRGFSPGSDSLDAAARDLYTRAHQPYEALLREAKQARLVRQAQQYVAQGRSLNPGQRLALWVGSGLIVTGQRITTLAGRPSPAAIKTLNPAGQD